MFSDKTVRQAFLNISSVYPNWKFPPLDLLDSTGELPESYVSFKTVFEQDRDRLMRMSVPLIFGKTNRNRNYVRDLHDLADILISGSVGVGKSALLDNFVMTILMTKSPDEVRIILIDAENIELESYEDIPFLITDVTSDLSRLSTLLPIIDLIIEAREICLVKQKVKDIDDFNKKYPFICMPQIVFVVDEFTDIMDVESDEFKKSLKLLIHKGRITGVSMIMVSKRMKEILEYIVYFDCRVGMQMSSKKVSKALLDDAAATKINIKGGMYVKDVSLFLPDAFQELANVQSAYVSPEEINRVVSFVKKQASDYEV